ncbi:hypothetical protein CAEBREN_02499 [Caenorhabditis brenneri]|uniref:Uncharacterized protein n=1 Tax=Caenorhabditis brenneri TaxID=135651 RepID=G0N1U6_CAEBE|nr:hypothetical protein CAEBREN_02499 [Caenorhabditis brenneri]
MQSAQSVQSAMSVDSAPSVQSAPTFQFSQSTFSIQSELTVHTEQAGQPMKTDQVAPAAQPATTIVEFKPLTSPFVSTSTLSSLNSVQFEADIDQYVNPPTAQETEVVFREPDQEVVGFCATVSKAIVGLFSFIAVMAVCAA